MVSVHIWPAPVPAKRIKFKFYEAEAVRAGVSVSP